MATEESTTPLDRFESGERPSGDPSSPTHPQLWPEAEDAPAPQAYRAEQRDEAPEEQRRTRTAAWIAVVTMLVGAILIALAIVVWSSPTSWILVAAGVVVGLAGVGLAVKANIFADVE